MAQDLISAHELVALYSKERDAALKYIEGKGYEPSDSVDFAMPIPKESSLFFKNKDDVGFSMILDNDRIWILLYFDSKENLRKILNELGNLRWKLSGKKEEAFEAYKNEQKNFEITYMMDLEYDNHCIQIGGNVSR